MIDLTHARLTLKDTILSVSVTNGGLGSLIGSCPFTLNSCKEAKYNSTGFDKRGVKHSPRRTCTNMHNIIISLTKGTSFSFTVADQMTSAKLRRLDLNPYRIY